MANASGVKKAIPKTKETVQAPSANTSRKRKSTDDGNKLSTNPPAAKKARTAQKAPPSKAKNALAKSRVTKPRAAKSTATKPAATKTTAAEPTAKKPPAAKPTATKSTSKKPAAAKPTATKPTAKKSAAVKSTATKPAVTKPTAPKTARTKTATAKASKAKPKVVINAVPTQRLDVYVFGEGSSSELGLGTAKTAIDVKRPRLNPLLSSQDVGVVHITCGGMHVAALTHDNKILTWGVNDQGALGRDTTWDGGLKDMDDNQSDDSDMSDSGLNPLESNPTAIPASSFPAGTTFVQLSAGDSHTLALTDEGLVYGWGCFRKTDGILGFRPGSSTEVEDTPILLPELKNIVQIISGANHAMAMDKKGAVFIWGSGEQNQLGYHIIQRTGTGNQKTTLKPQPLRTRSKNYKAIYTGSDHSFAVDQKDKVWAWGVNSFGGCGILEGAGDDNAVVYTPAHVKTLDLENDSITRIDGGQHHTIAITKNGKALIWGRVDGNQTGLNMATVPEDHTIQDDNGKARILTVPTPIPDVGEAVWASAGTDHTILINDQGIAYAWGLSATYQTGLAVTDDVDRPTHIDNTAVRGKKLNWSGCGGQYSIMTAPAGVQNLTNGI